MTIEAAITCDDLTRAASHLQASSDERCQRVGLRLAAWITGELDGLEAAMGIGGPGQRTLATRRTLAQRDELVRRLAAVHFPGLRATAQAERIHALLIRYHASAWPRERDAATCPARHRETPYAFAWAILQAHDRPLSARQLRKKLAPSSLERANFAEYSATRMRT